VGGPQTAHQYQADLQRALRHGNNPLAVERKILSAGGKTNSQNTWPSTAPLEQHGDRSGWPSYEPGELAMRRRQKVPRPPQTPNRTEHTLPKKRIDVKRGISKLRYDPPRPLINTALTGDQNTEKAI
jgi:hypothetical protein